MADNATDAVITGQEYFRLKREVDSSGDIYEVDQGTRAIYIGPDSDLGEVTVTYYNPSEPLGLETAQVAVNGPFVGRVDALMATQVSSTGQVARILISPADIVKPDYLRPTVGAINGPPKRRSNVPPVIDLICALKTLPAIPEVRADRVLRFPQVPYEDVFVGPPPNDGSTDIVIPLYARRMTSIQIVSAIGDAYHADFFLVALQPGQNTNPKFLGGYTQGGSTQVITRTVVIKASQSVQGDIAPQSSDINEPVGQGDLLVINISRSAADPPGPGLLQFVDVFVRISDRET